MRMTRSVWYFSKFVGTSRVTRATKDSAEGHDDDIERKNCDTWQG